MVKTLMNSFLTKKALIEIETLLSSVLVIVILLVTVSASIICYNNYTSDKPNQKNIISVYNNIVNNIRLDARRAVSVITTKESFSFFDKDSKEICKYELKDGNLVRYGNDNNISMLLEKVESLSFTTQENLPNLLTVRIFPEDKNEIPFFTSFALRGFDSKNEKK